MSSPRAVSAAVTVALVASAAGCIRGTLPAREFYRLALPDSVVLAGSDGGANSAPLDGTIAIPPYDAPGLYGTGAIVYRVGPARYGTYPTREWAIPLGEMLGTLTEQVLRARGVDVGNVAFAASSAAGGDYEWRGAIREFDEVDSPNGVAGSVELAARLVRSTDDSVVWSGVARAVEPVAEARRMDAVVIALSRAAARVVGQLLDEAALAARRRAASGAHAP